MNTRLPERIQGAHPIAAIATPLAPAALAVIRCAGAGSIELLDPLFSRGGVLTAAPGNTIHHGYISSPDGEPLDEVVVAVYRAPHSYTGEDAAEVFCHGSPAGVRLVVRALFAAGFDQAEPGEFTRRAFMNGKLDLTRAEAVNEIIRSQTARAHALALDRLAGGVEKRVMGIRSALVRVMASLAIQLDYPEEDTGEVPVDVEALASAEGDLLRLADTFREGRIFQEGVRLALAGRTNAGKSSLFNRLLQQDRSIVSDIHGTTRDYVESLLDIRGVPVRLFDTAGLRATSESIETEGIRRSESVIAASDLTLYLIAADAGVTSDDLDRIARIAEMTRVITVLNKSDLVPPTADRPGHSYESVVDGAQEGRAHTLKPPPIRVSAATGEGIEDLNDAIADSLLSDVRVAFPGEVVIDSERQHDLLRRAADAVARTRDGVVAHVPADAMAVDLQEALDAVGEITGEVTSAEILDVMFGSFCVGK